MTTLLAPSKNPKLCLVPPLVFLDEGLLSRLIKECRVRPVEKDERLVPKGSVPKELFISAEADLTEVVLDMEEGELIPAYEPIGLSNMISESPFPSAVVAEKETAVYTLPWEEVYDAIKCTPGLRTYLNLIAESDVVRELDLTLAEMGCSHPFRAALLGQIKRETLGPGTWLSREADIPTSIYCCVLGTLRAYKKVGNTAIKPLWLLPNMTWQLWDACMEGKPPEYLIKSVSRVQVFRLAVKTLKELQKLFPKDFQLFADLAASRIVEKEEEEEEAQEETESVEDLFPKAPRPVRSFRFLYPFVHQNDEMDCGPACLTMISRYFGNALPIQYWRSRLSTDRQGTSLFDLANVCEGVGFVCHGLEIRDLGSVESSLLPLIALRQEHYMVIYAANGERVIAGDPAVGIRKIPLGEFQEGFEGYVLMLKPTEQFYGETAPLQGYSHYLGLMNGFGFELSIIGVISILLTFLTTLPAFFTQFIIDEVLAKKDVKLLILAVGVAIVLTALIVLTNWLRTYYTAYLSSRFAFGAASAFLRKLYTLPYHFFATRHVGDFTRRLEELDRVRTFLTRRLITTALNFLNLGVYGLVLFLYAPAVAALVFIAAPMVTLISMVFSRKLQGFYNKSFVARADQDGLLADQIRGIGTIKSLGSEVAARWRFEEAVVKTLRSRYRLRIAASALESVSDLLRAIIDYGILGLAALLAIRGEMTAGQVISISILARGVTQPFASLAGMWEEIIEVRTVMDRLNDVFLAESELKPSRKLLIKQRMRGEIEFKDVWFRYGGESSEWVLKGLSFRIQPSQRVAIVGPSGSGKSTLALLMARMYEPQKGTILVDGRDYREYDRKWLRHHIGLLMQDSDLFHGSILENIAYGDPDPDRSRVEWAAQVAQAAEFINEKSAGYDYQISHGGGGLSGGQSQRIAIARILYANPTVLFLDEGTSALDPIAERQILEALKQRSQNQQLAQALKSSAQERMGSLVSALTQSTHDRDLLDALDRSAQDRTLISIMHRYSVVRFYDFILVMQAGVIEGQGTHDELLERGGLYAELYGKEVRS